MEILAITTASILSMFMNMSAVNDNSNNFVYNADVQNGTVHSIYAYTSSMDGKVLNAKTKYDYSYDAMNRVQCKTKYVCRCGEWVLDSKVNFTYHDEETSIDYQVWNGKDFDPVSERTVYQSLGNELLGVSQYKRGAEGIQLIDSYMLMNTNLDNLLAQGLHE